VHAHAETEATNSDSKAKTPAAICLYLPVFIFIQFNYRFGPGILATRLAHQLLHFVTDCITNAIYMLKIEWRDAQAKTPYLFRQIAEWAGVRIHRARVIAGRLLPHTADSHEVNVTLGGKLYREATSDGAVRKLFANSRTGNVCVTPAGKTIGAEWDDTIDNMGILLEKDFVAKTAGENRFSTQFDFEMKTNHEDPLIQHMGLALLTEAHSETPSGRLYADSIIQTLTLHLLKNYTTASGSPESVNGGLSGYRLKRVKEFIHASLDEDISLAEIAAVADLSQYHFARAFRKSTGLTPQQYLMQQRIESAKDLLTQADLPLVEISLRTGFKNQSHFTTLFRKFTNFTPKAWRELKLA